MLKKKRKSKLEDKVKEEKDNLNLVLYMNVKKLEIKKGKI